jgi:hypothetical protein
VGVAVTGTKVASRRRVPGLLVEYVVIGSGSASSNGIINAIVSITEGPTLMNALKTADSTTYSGLTETVIIKFPTTSRSSSSSGLSGGGIAGVVIGCIVFTIIVIAVALYVSSARGTRYTSGIRTTSASEHQNPLFDDQHPGQLPEFGSESVA